MGRSEPTQKQINASDRKWKAVCTICIGFWAVLLVSGVVHFIKSLGG